MWFVYALSFAIISSINRVLAKKVMRDTGEYLYLFVTNILSIIVLLGIILTFYSIPKVDSIFFISLLISSVFGVVGAVLAYRAIKISEISLVSPIAAFNPIFTAMISYVLLGELISKRGGVGMLFVVLGAYLLQASKVNNGILAPIRSLTSHKGVQMSLFAYLMWAITPIFEKTAISHTSPSVPPFASMIGSIYAVQYYAYKSIKSTVNIKLMFLKNITPFLTVGILGGVGQAVAFTAFSLTNLAYATAVFKLDMVFIVIMGYLFFGEKDIKDRLLGVLVMLLGVSLIVS